MGKKHQRLWPEINAFQADVPIDKKNKNSKYLQTYHLAKYLQHFHLECQIQKHVDREDVLWVNQEIFKNEKNLLIGILNQLIT